MLSEFDQMPIIYLNDFLEIAFHICETSFEQLYLRLASCQRQFQIWCLILFRSEIEFGIPIEPFPTTASLCGHSYSRNMCFWVCIPWCTFVEVKDLIQDTYYWVAIEVVYGYIQREVRPFITVIRRWGWDVNNPQLALKLSCKGPKLTNFENR